MDSESDHSDLAYLCAELAGKAVAATMRDDCEMAGIALLPDGTRPGGYVGDVVVISNEADAAWVEFAGVWAQARLHCWMHDERPLDRVGRERRQRLLRDLVYRLDVSDVECLLRYTGGENFGPWVLELETVWPVVLMVTDWLMEIAVNGGEPPTDERIAELRSAQPASPAPILWPLIDVLSWRLT